MLKNVIFLNKIKHFKILAWNDVFKNLDFIRFLEIMLKKVYFLTFFLLLDFFMDYSWAEVTIMKDRYPIKWDGL